MSQVQRVRTVNWKAVFEQSMFTDSPLPLQTQSRQPVLLRSCLLTQICLHLDCHWNKCLIWSNQAEEIYLFLGQTKRLASVMLPKPSPSSRVFGRCLQRVSGKKRAAMPPRHESEPMMTRGKILLMEPWWEEAELLKYYFLRKQNYWLLLLWSLLLHFLCNFTNNGPEPAHNQSFSLLHNNSHHPLLELSV